MILANAKRPSVATAEHWCCHTRNVVFNRDREAPLLNSCVSLCTCLDCGASTTSDAQSYLPSPGENIPREIGIDAPGVLIITVDKSINCWWYFSVANCKNLSEGFQSCFHSWNLHVSFHNVYLTLFTFGVLFYYSMCFGSICSNTTYTAQSLISSDHFAMHDWRSLSQRDPN